MAVNAAWHLEDIADSLVVELDKTRETLAIRAINKPLTYTVKDVALDLHVFPSYDGDQVSFVTAQPGQEGASTVTMQLNSITDQQVRATTKTPTAAKDDVPIEEIDIAPETKSKLRKLGVSSVDDLNAIERKNVDLRRVSGDEIDYSKLANQIRKTRRGETPPKISGVALSRAEDARPCLIVRGQNLAVDPSFQPVAVINGRLAEVLSSSVDELRIDLDDHRPLKNSNEVVMTFDPFAVVKVNVRA